MIGLQNSLIVLFLAFENVYLFESITEDMTNDINLLNLLLSNILNLEKILRQKKQIWCTASETTQVIWFQPCFLSDSEIRFK